MKKTNKIAIAVAISSALLLSACEKASTDAPDAETKRSQTCKRLHRQMVYNRHNMNTEASWLARSQTQRLKQLYKENNCKN